MLKTRKQRTSKTSYWGVPSDEVFEEKIPELSALTPKDKKSLNTEQDGMESLSKDLQLKSEMIDDIQGIYILTTDTAKVESKYLEKGDNIWKSAVKNKQALKPTAELKYTQHTDSLFLIDTGENSKEKSQPEMSDENLESTDKNTRNFQKLEQSLREIEVPNQRKSVSESVIQDNGSFECQEIKDQGQMDIELQAKDEKSVVSDSEQIYIENTVQLDQTQIDVCDSRVAARIVNEESFEQTGTVFYLYIESCCIK